MTPKKDLNLEFDVKNSSSFSLHNITLVKDQLKVVQEEAEVGLGLCSLAIYSSILSSVSSTSRGVSVEL